MHCADACSGPIRLTRSGAMITILLSGFILHLIVFFGALWATRVVARITEKRRVDVFPMGRQKTLPLPTILQGSLFQNYVTVLVVGVLHRIIHLIMDGCLVRYFNNRKV